MAIFDQRGQTVTYQYNAAGDINLGAVQNRMDLAGELDKIKAELVRAKEGNAIDEDTEEQAQLYLGQAARQAKAPEPDKTTLLERLKSAKECLAGVAAVGGIVEAVSKAYEWVQGAF